MSALIQSCPIFLLPSVTPGRPKTINYLSFLPSTCMWLCLSPNLTPIPHPPWPPDLPTGACGTHGSSVAKSPTYSASAGQRPSSPHWGHEFPQPSQVAAVFSLQHLFQTLPLDWGTCPCSSPIWSGNSSSLLNILSCSEAHQTYCFFSLLEPSTEVLLNFNGHMNCLKILLQWIWNEETLHFGGGGREGGSTQHAGS